MDKTAFATRLQDVHELAKIHFPTLEGQIAIYDNICEENNWRMRNMLATFKEKLPTINVIDFSGIGVPFIIARHRGYVNDYSCRVTINRHITAAHKCLQQSNIKLHISGPISENARANFMTEKTAYNGKNGFELKIANFSTVIKPNDDLDQIINSKKIWMTFTEFLAIAVHSPLLLKYLCNNDAAALVLFGSLFVVDGVEYYAAVSYSTTDQTLFVSSFIAKQQRSYEMVAPYTLSMDS